MAGNTATHQLTWDDDLVDTVDTDAEATRPVVRAPNIADLSTAASSRPAGLEVDGAMTAVLPISLGSGGATFYGGGSNSQPTPFRVLKVVQPFNVSQPLAEWHGEVDSIDGDSFVATLRGKIGEGVAGVTEEAQIPIAEVRPDDLPLLQEGAFFRLCITYIYDRGARRRITDVIFRRMPAYRREELEAARESALELLRGIRVE